jgi:rubrerythrin
VGLLLAATYTDATATNIAHIYADCAGLASFIDRQHQALAYSCPMAGIWRQIIEKPAWPHMRIHQTKAHRSLAQATKADDRQHFVGNDIADGSAKEAAGKHRVQDPELSAFIRAAKHTQTSLTQAVEALIKYNTFVLPLELQPLPPGVKRQEHAKRHAYQRFELNLWICRSCGHHTKTNPFPKKIPKCDPFSPIITTLFGEHIDAQSTKGHNLRLASSGPLTKVVYGMRCGSYGTHRFANLHKQCRRRASGQSARLTFFQNNQHPNGGAALYNIVHVTFDFIQTLLSQPTYEGPTEAQIEGTLPPPPTVKLWPLMKYTTGTYKATTTLTQIPMLIRTISVVVTFDT